PISVKYDLLTTMLSLILAILAGAGLLSICVIGWRRRQSALLLMVAVLLGLAPFGAMHLLGMMAMHGIGKELIMRFEPLQFSLWLIFALAAYTNTYIVYLIGSKKDDHYIWWVKFGAAATIGFVYASYHYIGVAST